MRSGVFAGWLLLTLTAVPALGGPANYPLKVSANKRFLVDQNNVPVFINGDTAWSLIAQLSREDAEHYLQDRGARGVNSIIVTCPEAYYCSKCRDSDGPQNYYGASPFTTANLFTTPNEAYWQHADWVIHKAAEYGVQVMLCPFYSGYDKNKDGWWTDDWDNKNREVDCTWYGQWIGKRYKNFPNIVWVIGNDRNPGILFKKINSLAEGIKSQDSNHLFTHHSGGGYSAADPAVWSPNAVPSWLSLNGTYDYPGDPSPHDYMYVKSYADYNRLPTMPFVLFESHYEYAKSWGNGMFQGSPLNIRKQAYQSVFCGSTGHHCGNNAIWGMGSVPDYQPGCELPWKEHLGDPGSSVFYVGKLMQSREWFTLVPDQNHTVMIAGYGSGSSYAPCARTQGGATVMVHIPDPRTITIDMSKISGGRVKCWWFNPRSGDSSYIGRYPSRGKRDFRVPDSDDWVLVLDDASKNFPAPGTTEDGRGRRGH
jgi:hypothetical protein